LLDRLYYIVIGVVLLVIAFPLASLCWRWWWPQIQRAAGQLQVLSGEASPEGVRLAQPGNEVIAWKAFIAAKLNDRTALLYLTRTYALPFHRSLFLTDQDWEAFLALVRASSKNVQAC